MFEIVLSSYYITLKQAIDRLPLIPGILEIVGIGYTGVSKLCLIAGIVTHLTPSMLIRIG